MEAVFEFEKPIVNLEKKLQDLKELTIDGSIDFSNEIKMLEKKILRLIDDTYSKLTPWQKVQLSRHPNRPYTADYINLLFPDFMELQGDRLFGEDQAILGGIAKWPPVHPMHAKKSEKPNLQNNSILILGHQKGRSTKQKMERNFGMPKPEGYRKAMRLMQLADRCKIPILTFIDTPGAYPGVEAEERGQSQALAETIHSMFNLRVPTFSIVIGEGGSGGALALGITDLVFMQEYSTYSVITPESCAAILWRDSNLAEKASDQLKMNPNNLLQFGVINGVIPEPKGGAHRNWAEASQYIYQTLTEDFDGLIKNWKKNLDKTEKLIQNRVAKFRSIGIPFLDHAPMNGN